MTLSWGIAATGRIARTVGAVIAEHPDMRVAAVGSRHAGRAAALAAELGASRSHASYQALIADHEVEAVYVATPHACHGEVVAASLRAGKAVLCEKPLTHETAETQRLVDLARATGSFLMEGMWMRFNPLVQRLRDQVWSGDLGEVRLLQASIGMAAPYDAGARLWSPALGGGALLDLGVYTVDLARLLLGPPVAVEARGSLAPTGVDADSVLAVSWAGGARALLAQSLLVRLPGTAVVVGERGWAELSPTFHGPSRLVVQLGGDDLRTHEIVDRRVGFVGELEEVVRCLAAGLGESPVMPLADSLANARVLDDARRQLGA